MFECLRPSSKIFVLFLAGLNNQYEFPRTTCGLDCLLNEPARPPAAALEPSAASAGRCILLRFFVFQLAAKHTPRSGARHASMVHARHHRARVSHAAHPETNGAPLGGGARAARRVRRRAGALRDHAPGRVPRRARDGGRPPGDRRVPRRDAQGAQGGARRLQRRGRRVRLPHHGAHEGRRLQARQRGRHLRDARRRRLDRALDRRRHQGAATPAPRRRHLRNPLTARSPARARSSSCRRPSSSARRARPPSTTTARSGTRRRCATGPTRP